MRRTATYLATVALAAAVLTGCTDDDKPAAQPAAPPAAEHTTPAQDEGGDEGETDISEEQRIENFNAALSLLNPALAAKHADLNILPVAGSIACGWINAGRTPQQAAQELVDSNHGRYTYDEAWSIVAAGIPAYCPTAGQ